jgi:hypothetical protein
MTAVQLTIATKMMGHFNVQEFCRHRLGWVAVTLVHGLWSFLIHADGLIEELDQNGEYVGPWNFPDDR